jgi:hypothetical protein
MPLDRRVRGLFFPLGLLLLHTASAFFPDLSGYPSDTTELLLEGTGITDVPAGAFVRFAALQTLYASHCALAQLHTPAHLSCQEPVAERPHVGP